MAKRAGHPTAPTTVNSSVRTRRYLTVVEVERLMSEARKSGRCGHRDATMILLAFRHGLRALELCDLMWHQVELATGRLHVRRVKSGSPSVHPMQGDEIRALLLPGPRELPEPAAATPSIRCKRRIRHYPPANVDSCSTGLATSELRRMFLQLAPSRCG